MRILLLLVAVMTCGCQHFRTEVAVTYHTPETDIQVKVYK